jgi:hypothetical protein
MGTQFADRRLPSEVFRGITQEEWVLYGADPNSIDRLTDDARLSLLENSDVARRKYAIRADGLLLAGSFVDEDF